jgi:hypothetical protein
MNLKFNILVVPGQTFSIPFTFLQTKIDDKDIAIDLIISDLDLDTCFKMEIGTFSLNEKKLESDAFKITFMDLDYETQYGIILTNKSYGKGPEK